MAKDWPNSHKRIVPTIMTLSDPRAWTDAEGFLRRAQSILAITHMQPDGDAIGSLLAFTHAMRALGKQVTPTCQDKPQARFEFLNGVHDVKQNAGEKYDLIVALDSSDLLRLGNIFMPALHANLPMVVFDHHITNTQYGTVNVVEPGMASTCEVVYRLLNRLGIALNNDISAALLTGIITDTLAFRTSNTTPDTLATAMECMRVGASLTEITRRALVMRPYESLKLLGAGLSAAHLDERIVYASITRKLRKEIGNREERGDGGLVGQLITANEADVAVVFVELSDGNIEIGFRAAPGFDISQVAVEFGGGGHPAAAGCTIPGPMRDAVNRVIQRLKQSMKEA